LDSRNQLRCLALRVRGIGVQHVDKPHQTPGFLKNLCYIAAQVGEMKLDHLFRIRGTEKPAALRSKTSPGVLRRRYRHPETLWPQRMPGIHALTDILSSSAEDDRIFRPRVANLHHRGGSVLNIFTLTTLKGYNTDNDDNTDNNDNNDNIDNALGVVGRTINI
jgi:hypothetical protein